MLTEERWNAIIELVDRKKAVTVPELEKELDVSAATIRRDLTELNRMGRIVKVHGGADQRRDARRQSGPFHGREAHAEQ